MSRQHHLPWFNHLNDIIMQFSPRSVFLPFRFKFPPKHSVLKNSQSVFLKVRDQVSHPYSTTGKIRALYILSFRSFYSLVGKQTLTWRLSWSVTAMYATDRFPASSVWSTPFRHRYYYRTPHYSHQWISGLGNSLSSGEFHDTQAYSRSAYSILIVNNNKNNWMLKFILPSLDVRCMQYGIYQVLFHSKCRNTKRFSPGIYYTPFTRMCGATHPLLQ
jgi:hypothetical protein